jgi:predicted transcriptional regulator YheO
VLTKSLSKHTRDHRTQAIILLCLNLFYSNQALHQLIVMMKSTIIHFKQYLIAA